MSFLEGMIPPSPECELPEPIRPEGDAGIMVTETCPHCNTRFLLVNASKKDSPTGERWLDAEAYWAENRRHERNYTFEYPYHYERYRAYPQFEETDYGVSGFDFPHQQYKNVRIDPEELS